MADDYVRRTAITRLSVTDEQRDLLEQTISEWKRGCQLATDMAWGTCNGKSDVQPLAYDEVREQTGLGSQHAILATHQAAQAITGCLERHSSGKKVSKPTFSARDGDYFLHLGFRRHRTDAERDTAEDGTVLGGEPRYRKSCRDEYSTIDQWARANPPPPRV